MRTINSILIILGALVSYINGNDVDERIVNGYRAKPGQLPYMVSITVTKTDDHRAICGGSLISDQYVLTAAHCLRNVTSIKVQLGSVKRNNEDGVIYDEIPAENGVAHEEFGRRHAENDIAVIKLPTPVNFTDEIQPIALAKKEWEDSNTFLGRKVRASGWGKLGRDEGASNTLQYVDVTVMDNKKCVKYYKGAASFAEKLVCTQDKKSRHTGAPCKGDSGGPIVVNEDGERYVIGLVSIGSGGCGSGRPQVYTNVAYYLDWINEKTQIPIE